VSFVVSPYRWENNDLVLWVLLQTQASHDQIVGLHGEQIRIRITAAPIDGKANKHLIGFLAKQFAVAKSQISIEKGQTSRSKRIRILFPSKWPSVIQTSKNAK